MEVQASAFGPSGRTSGRLRIGSGAAHFHGSGASFSLPLAGLRLKFGGASNRLLFLEHPDQPDWSFYTSDLNLLGAPELVDHPATAALNRSRRQRRYLRLGTAAAVVAVLLIVPLVLLAGWSHAVRFAAGQVPASWEEQLGQSAVDEYAAAAGVDCDGPRAQQLTRLAAALVEAQGDSRYDFRFCLSDTEDINAFAVPGGTIVVQQGLIDAADDVDELLGVLAHEIAHVSEQHGVRSVINSLGWLAALQLLFGDASGVAGAVVAAAPLLIHLQYSQSFEHEADTRAVALMEAAGTDPHGLTRFFAKLLKSEAAGGVEMPQFLSSHPATTDRIAAIERLITVSDPASRPMDENFMQLKSSHATIAAEALGSE